MKFLEVFLPIIISLITLIVTIYIPIRIMQYQRYTNLTAVYMNCEFGYAFHSVIDFFHNTCDCDVERIPEEYVKRYYSDMEKLKKGDINAEDVLHYQRRLLSVYFSELEFCRVSNRKLGRMIKKNWTTSEANVIKIIICMNNAVDEYIKEDISSIKYQFIPRVKGISSYLSRLSKKLEQEKSWMQM